jgi:hypothetical protein
MIIATCAGSRLERFEVESVLSSVDTLSSQLGNCVTTRRLKTFLALFPRSTLTQSTSRALRTL